MENEILHSAIINSAAKKGNLVEVTFYIKKKNIFTVNEYDLMNAWSAHKFERLCVHAGIMGPCGLYIGGSIEENTKDLIGKRVKFYLPSKKTDFAFERVRQRYFDIIKSDREGNIYAVWNPIFYIKGLKWNYST